MNHIARMLGAAALIVGTSVAVSAAANEGPSDAEIAHIAYTAGQIDVDAARQALAKSQNAEVRSFATTMVRDHEAVNDKALALVKKLGVTPTDNATSKALAKQARETEAKLAALNGVDFDLAYANNEVAFHRTVNGALASNLIPSADNSELKALLQTGASLFGEHQAHAEQLAAGLK